METELVLTDADQAERDAWDENYEEVGCTCFQCAPCGSCTHPGNPLNQAEEESCWIEVEKFKWLRAGMRAYF